MNPGYEISRQHLSGDEGVISFTISFGHDMIRAVISRAALTAMDGLGGRHILLVFDENHGVIARAAYRKLNHNPSVGVLALGMDDFQH